ncbi:MAG: hypothetical protein NC489_09100 [Ruminococcus flavefaciens]|nr:hypothetical protein [Ruminococcus flavefaciens]
MIHVVTTNPIDISSIHEYANNFIICHVYQKVMLPLADGSMGYHFKIYHQDGMDLCEYDEYENQPNFKYEFIPVATITEALDHIVEDVYNSEVDLELDAEDDDSSPDQLILSVCGSTMKLTYMMCKYMNNQFKEEESESTALNLYKYLRMVKLSQIADSMKMQLGTDMVYEEDPVAFSYVLSQLMNGVML